MVRIEASKNGSTYQLDVDEKPELIFEAIDIEQFFARKASRSESFTLPFTKANDSFFEKFYEVNMEVTTTGFNPYLKTECRIIDNGIVIMDGYLKLNHVDTKKQNYQVVVLDKFASLINDIGNQTIADLVDGELDHDLNYTNVVNSWSKTLESGNVVYPFIDWGEGWYFGAGGINESNTPANVTQFRPAVSVYYLLNKIFTDNGYTWDSTFLESSFFKNIYMTFVNGKSILSLDEVYSFSAESNAVQTATGELAVNLPVENYDNRNTFVSNVFTSLSDGNHTFNYTVELTENLATAQTAQIYVKKNGAVDFVSETAIPLAASDTKTVSNTFTLNLGAGDTVQLFVFGFVDVSIGATFTLISSPISIVGSSINLADNIDERLKQRDFVKAIFERFNLYAIPTPEIEKEIIIEPYADFYALGTSRDWTNKVAIDESFVIEPMSDYRLNRIKFEDNDTDNYLVERLNRLDFLYGSIEFESTDAFAEGEFKVASIFEPLPVAKIAGSNLITGANYKQEEGTREPRDSKPNLIYFDSATTLTSDKQFYLDNNGTAVNQTSVAIGASLPIPFTNSDVSLDFQLTSFNYNEVVESKSSEPDVFSKYWRQYITELYSDEARYVKCKAILSPSDLNSLRLYDSIFIKDTFYKISKIKGFVAGESSKCTVELIKQVDVLINDCSQVPDTYNKDGTISFVSVTDGSAATPTRECCERVGGLFRQPASGDVCYWKWGAQQGSAGDLEGVGQQAVGANNVSNTSTQTSVYGSGNTVAGRGQQVSIQGNNNSIESDVRKGQIIGDNATVLTSKQRFIGLGNATIFSSDQFESFNGDTGYGMILSEDRLVAPTSATALYWEGRSEFLAFNQDGLYMFELWIVGKKASDNFTAKYSGAFTVSSGTHALIGTPTEEWSYATASTTMSVSSVGIASGSGLQVNVQVSLTPSATFTAVVKYVRQ